MNTTLTARQKTIIAYVLETPFILVPDIVRTQPYKVLFYMDYSIDCLKRQLIKSIEHRQDSDLISTYKEKINEVLALKNTIIENIDEKLLKTPFIC